MEEAEFEVWQDGFPVARCSGQRDKALSEALHYCFVYGQDGPVQLFELSRKQIDFTED